MENRPFQLAVSPFSQMSALLDCTSASQLCCAYARDAAEHGQFAAAHSLFQSAVAFYDRAQNIASTPENFSHVSRFNEEVTNPLLNARAELDSCALFVYPDFPPTVPLHREELL